jgi:hypothetical protein
MDEVYGKRTDRASDNTRRRCRDVLAPTACLEPAAPGVDESRPAVHWQYAQTHWYYDAAPNDQWTWGFTNQTPEAFECTLYLAGPRPDVGLQVRIDGQPARALKIPPSDGWNHFVPLRFRVPVLEPGSRRLTVRVAPGAGPTGSRVLQVRDAQLMAIGD